MIRKPFFAVTLLAAAATICPAPIDAQEVPAEYQQVLSTLGKQGDFKDNVLKVNIPRNDVKVTVAGVATPTPRPGTETAGTALAMMFGQRRPDQVRGRGR